MLVYVSRDACAKPHTTVHVLQTCDILGPITVALYPLQHNYTLLSSTATWSVTV